MAHTTSYWRSIKFNWFIARVRSKYYIKKRYGCYNRYDLLNLSFILKIPIFSKVYLPSRTYMVQLFLRKLFVGFSQKSSITDVRLDCKYVSTFTLTPFLSLKYIYFLIHQPCCLMLFNWQHTIKTLLSNELLINSNLEHTLHFFKMVILMSKWKRTLYQVE